MDFQANIYGLDRRKKTDTEGKDGDQKGDLNFAGLVSGGGPSTKPSHKDRIAPSQKPSNSYYIECKKIYNDPVERQRYFPTPKSVRRVRTWAGSSTSASQAAGRKWNLPQNCAPERPFAPFKKI